MNLKMKPKCVLFGALLLSASFAQAQNRNVIRVNSDVTTHIIMPENLKMVDISTDRIIGNQCADNMVRIKPANPDSIDSHSYWNKEFLGTITLIGERHIAQYDVLYDSKPMCANSIFNVQYDQTQAYNNPEVSMPESDMARFAWAIYGTKRKFNNLRTKSNGIKGSIFNVYSIGDYFFIDFGLENCTNIEYDIDEINVSLNDKKESKATNSQTIQLSPVFMLNDAPRFKKSYRQVMVLDKLTFPNEKVVNITISEKQISGRTITLNLEYDDILHADGFDISKAEKNAKVKYVPYRINDKPGKTKVESTTVTVQDESILKKNAELEKSVTSLNKRIKTLLKENSNLLTELESSNSKVSKMQNEISELNVSLDRLQTAYDGANNTINKMLGKSRQ